MGWQAITLVRTGIRRRCRVGRRPNAPLAAGRLGRATCFLRAPLVGHFLVVQPPQCAADEGREQADGRQEPPAEPHQGAQPGEHDEERPHSVTMGRRNAANALFAIIIRRAGESRLGSTGQMAHLAANGATGVSPRTPLGWCEIVSAYVLGKH